LFDEPEADTESDDAMSNEEGQKSIVVAAHIRQRKPRISLPPELPREDIVYDLPESEKVCSHDGIELKEMGEQVHEQLDIIPAQIRVFRHVRKTYAVSNM